jgi:hypothetical protein
MAWCSTTNEAARELPRRLRGLPNEAVVIEDRSPPVVKLEESRGHDTAWAI